MIRFALMLAALMIAAMPAAFGVLHNASFTPERPARISEQTTDPTAPQLQRPEPQVDRRVRSQEDFDSRRMERRQAHNGGND
jgi:Flp pilus assembly protein TadB